MIKNSWWDIDRFLTFLYLSSSALFFLVFFRGFKLQIREGGIYYSANSVKWDRLTSYRWKGEDSYILGLYIRGDSYPYWLESYKISQSQKDAADRVLAQHLSSS